MSAAGSKPKCKRIFSLAVKIYAGLCTLLVSTCLAFWLWSLVSSGPGAKPDIKGVFLTSYGAYMATEYPQRGNRFRSMIETLRECVGETSISETDLFRYLGKPDEFYATNAVDGAATNKIVLFAYSLQPPGAANREFAIALVADGKLEQVAIQRQGQKNAVGFQPFPGDSAPNPQGGANGRQPSGSESNRTSSAAASRRSP